MSDLQVADRNEKCAIDPWSTNAETGKAFKRLRCDSLGRLFVAIAQLPNAPEGLFENFGDLLLRIVHHCLLVQGPLKVVEPSQSEHVWSANRHERVELVEPVFPYAGELCLSRADVLFGGHVIFVSERTTFELPQAGTRRSTTKEK